MIRELKSAPAHNSTLFVTATDVINAWLKTGTIRRYDPSARRPALNSIGHSKGYTYKFTALQFEDKRILPYPLAVRLARDLNLDELKTAAFLTKIIHEKFVKNVYKNIYGGRIASFYVATKDKAFLDFNIVAFIDRIMDESQHIITHLIDGGFDLLNARNIYRSIFDNPVNYLYARLDNNI